MKTLTLVVVAVVALTAGCVSRPAFQNTNAIPEIFADPAEKNNPAVILDAYPRVGFTPLRVTLKAVLQNVPADDSSFPCMWQSWAFGDGAVSSEKKDCQGAVAQSEFYVEHVYREEGVYEIRFSLGENHLISNAVQVRVIARGY